MAREKLKVGDWVEAKRSGTPFDVGVIVKIDADATYKIMYINKKGDQCSWWIYSTPIKKIKPKVGDQVRIRNDIEAGTPIRFGFVEDMEKIAQENKIEVIITIDDDCILLKDIGFSWSSEMLIPVNDKQAEIEIEIGENLKMDTKNIEKELKNIVKELKQQNTFDDVIKDEMVKKVKDIKIEELTEELHKKIDRYIKDTFGILPRKIEITNKDIKKEMTGLFHKKFDEILKIVDKGVPLMLTGSAGAGKNHTLEQVAEALELDFYFTNAITQEYKLTGFIDANGVYQETQFYKAFKDGGLFFLDEIDASCPESLIILNSAIANGYFDFPNGRINAHKNFRVVCAGNTFGTGADMIYVGRNALDGATLDRFATIEFEYDENIERQLAYDTELYEFIRDLRKAIKDASLRYIVSMRATINASKLLEIGMDKESILKSVIIKNMQIDDLNTIIKKIDNRSEWRTCLERIKDEMDRKVEV